MCYYSPCISAVNSCSLNNSSICDDENSVSCSGARQQRGYLQLQGSEHGELAGVSEYLSVPAFISWAELWREFNGC